MILFSVIIPHYNSISSLKQLIGTIPIDESVQLIVIDDKSQNDITEIENIITLRKGIFLRNTTSKKGAGVCRNLGLAHATGKWLIFADADDYFLKGAFDILKAYTDSKADIIYFSPISRHQNTEVPSKRHIPYERLVHQYVKCPSEHNEMMLRYKFMSPCSKMVRNHLVQDYDILYDETPASNDVMFSMRTAFHAIEIAASIEQIYCITQSGGTLTTQKDIRNYWARVEVFAERFQYLQNHLDMRKYGYVLPNGLGMMVAAAKKGYSMAFVYKIFCYFKKKNVSIISVRGILYGILHRT